MQFAVVPACVLIAVTLAGCATSRSDSAGVKPVSAHDVLLDERLGVDDLFIVRVVGEGELSGEYRVGRDGTIDFPYIGRLTVAGMAPGDVQRLVTEKLK